MARKLPPQGATESRRFRVPQGTHLQTAPSGERKRLAVAIPKSNPLRLRTRPKRGSTSFPLSPKAST